MILRSRHKIFLFAVNYPRSESISGVNGEMYGGLTWARFLSHLSCEIDVLVSIKWDKFLQQALGPYLKNELLQDQDVLVWENMPAY